MARRVKLAVAAAVLVVGLTVFFIWAPVVPFERLVSVEAPTSALICPGSQTCSVQPYQVWVRSYGSFAYDFLGYGTAPFVGPVSVEKNGVTNVMIFNGVNQTDSVAFPTSDPEPIPILRINGVSFYPHGAPFGGSVVQVSVTNMGVGETASVSWYLGSSSSANFILSPTQIPAGGTALLNATSWSGPLPAQNSYVTVTLDATLYYAKYWLYAQDMQTVQVVYSS